MDDQEQDGPTGNRLPQLDELYDAIQAPEAKQNVGDAIAIVNNHLQSAEIADANTRAGQNMVDDWTRYTAGMQKWVSNDPTALHSALDSVEPLARGLVRSIPGYPEDRLDSDHQEITRTTQRDIALAAVRSMADKHAGLTADMLADPRVQGLLSDEDRTALATHANDQAIARDLDGRGTAVMRDRAAGQMVQQRAESFLSGLHDPVTGGEAFSPGWHQVLINDGTLSNAGKSILADTYSKLQTQGDAKATDPFLLHRLAGDIANGGKPSMFDLAQAVTDNSMRVQDAVHTAALDKHEASSLFASLQAGRDVLIGRDGENGAAGVRAYSRFAQYLMEQYRQGGPGSLNPGSDRWTFDASSPRELASKFYPSGNDILPVADYSKSGPSDGFVPRQPLGEIFGKSRLTPDSIDPAVRMFGGYGTLRSNEDSLVPGRLPATLRPLPNTGEEGPQGSGGDADTVIRNPPEPITDAMPRVTGQTDTFQGSPARVFHSRGVNHPRNI